MILITGAGGKTGRTLVKVLSKVESVCALIHREEPLMRMKKAGADRVGIAVDAATPELFDQLRGKGVGGPHRWYHYWKVVEMAAAVFGKFYIGIHLIVGLG